MIDLTQIVIALIGLAVSLITSYLIPYINTHISSDKLDLIRKWAEVAVKCAELTYSGDKRGTDKKQFVIDFLKSKGFAVNTSEVEAIIEATVLEMNRQKEGI